MNWTQKQPILLQGSNIIISNYTISSTAGSGITQKDLDSIQSNVTTMQGDLEGLKQQYSTK
jgi:hypothetical protein